VKLILLTLLCCIVQFGQVNAKPLLFVGSSFPLILEQAPNGKINGVAVDIISAITEHSNQTYQIVVVPWKRAQSLLQDGDADMLIGPYKTLERQKYIDYSSIPFYSDQMVFYTLKDNTFDWQGDYSKLIGKLIGLPLGWTGGESFEAHRSNLRIYDVPEVKNGFEMLLRKRIDLVLSNRRNALVMSDELNISAKLRSLEPTLQITQGYFGFSKHHDVSQLKALFERQLNEMLNNGSIKRINLNYELEY
jgi:polar amino acid transport system substrate-binding protein